MTRRLWSAVRLFLRVQVRSGFVQVYLGVAIATVAIVRFLVPSSWSEALIPALLLGEYGTMGVFLVAAQSYLARGERSVLALAVTPLTRFERVAALVLASALVALGAGTLVFVGTQGVDGRAALLTLPLLATAILAGSVGLILASRYREFTRFLLGAIPMVTLFSLPFLSFFGLAPRLSFVWLPWDAALYSFSNLVRDTPSLLTYLVLNAELGAFAAVALVWAARVEAVE